MFDTLTDADEWLAGRFDIELEAVESINEVALAASEPNVPADLDAMEPGPVLAAFLSAIDVHTVSGYDRVTVLRARQRLVSHHAAGLMDDIVAVSEVVEDDWDDDAVSAAEAAAAEIRVALRLTRRAADNELYMARDLKIRLPQVWKALRRGDIDPRRARAISHATIHLDDAVTDAVVGAVIDKAPELTTGQIMARIKRLAIEVAPETAKQRFAHSVEQRRMVAQPTPDGTSNLMGLDLPPERVAAATRFINQLARSMSGPSDDRTMDQIRADVMLDLLNGANVNATPSRAVVDITVDLATLAGLNDLPGELAGFGPVIADIARKVALDQPDAMWQYTVRDPETGRAMHTGVTKRRPNRKMARGIMARNRRCIFVGCRMPARQSDLDHRKAWSEGGKTSGDNLAPLCRHDHGIKHAAGWTYTLNDDGSITWTSRLGRKYRIDPDPP